MIVYRCGSFGLNAIVQCLLEVESKELCCIISLRVLDWFFLMNDGTMIIIVR